MKARTLAVLAALAPALAAAQQAPNPIHPLFAPLDAGGKPAARSADVSAERTCGACHDAAFIATHSGHSEARSKATCIECHVDGASVPVDRLEAGKLRREDVRIGKAGTASCGRCHGVVSDGAAPVVLPADLEAPAASGRTFSLTLGEGAIVAPQRMSDSFLDLEGKAALDGPWDVHAAKLVDCAACHFARNDPARGDARRSRLEYVARDPRRPATAQFLFRPDHRLAAPDCRSCHEPLRAHAFLPYRERHMAVLACETCHVPSPRGPALEAVDGTVATASGAPALRWRNVERREGEPLNASTVRPLRPLVVVRRDADGARRLAPVNLVTRWRWISGPDRAEVPQETVRRAFLDGAQYAPEIVAALDANRDGRLDEAELRLDTKEKTDLVANRLRALGVARPAIEGEIEAHPLAHGVQGRDRALRDCEECHERDSRLSGGTPVAAFLPGGVPPRPPPGGGRFDLAGKIVPSAGGGLELVRAPGAGPGPSYVLGHSRQALTNRIGFVIFAAVVVAVWLHGFTRFLFRRSAARARLPHAEKEYVFGRYERLWHWTMAGSGVVLMATGLEIHWPAEGWPLSLPAAVTVHNAAAVVLMVNGFLSLFYHLTTSAIRHFIPHPHGLLQRTLDHLQYQSRGIFQGDPHPHHPGHKLNPLQQVTYLGLLAVLFPFQIASGVLIWAIGHWPSFGAALGGLGLVAPAHNLGAWLFLTFFVLHGYLVTTGPTLGEHLRSMVTGYRSVPGESSPQGA